LVFPSCSLLVNKAIKDSIMVFLDIIHQPVFIETHISETELRLHLLVVPIQLGTISRANPYLRTLTLTQGRLHNPSTAQNNLRVLR
jgi:hypothetical protein